MPLKIEQATSVLVIAGEVTPAVKTTSETIPIFAVRKGDTILSAHLQKLTLSNYSDTTYALGDGGDVDRFVNEADWSAGSVGDFVAPITAAFPYVYTADDTVDLRYVESGSDETLIPKVRFVVIMVPGIIQPGR